MVRALPALVFAMLLGAASIAIADEPGFEAENAKQCLDCHENSGVLGILKTKHADFENPDSPAAQKQCQSCHGPSTRHMQFPMQVENLHFGKASKAPPRVQNQQCLECHENGARENWEASAHGFEDVLCSNCHSIHQPDRIIPTEPNIVTTCTGSCHQDLMDDADPDSFSHPVGMKLEDGASMTCATCHNPHGKLDSTRCLECHKQTAEVLAKQSPKAQRFHKTAAEKGTDCIRCHKGLAHPIEDLESANGDDAVHEPIGPVSLR
jgi:nitrate/TMAO reductase-like tetraheme cytochrome c subunit